MARVTVEDCITKVKNRFELVILAAQRSRQISSGAPLTMDRDNDKNPVVALREIAGESVNPDSLMDACIQNNRQYQAKPDEKEEELDSILSEDKSTKRKSIEIGASSGDVPQAPEGAKANSKAEEKSEDKAEAKSKDDKADDAPSSEEA